MKKKMTKETTGFVEMPIHVLVKQKQKETFRMFKSMHHVGFVVQTAPAWAVNQAVRYAFPTKYQ